MGGARRKGGWHRVAQGTHEVAGIPALVVEIVDQDFEDWRHLVLIAALRVKITHTTERMIRVGSYGFTHDPEGRSGWHTHVTADEDLEIARELHARKERQHYGVPLRNYATVPAHESVLGWVVEAVTRDPAGGTPRCTVFVRDKVGNSYQATLARQEPQTYG